MVKEYRGSYVTSIIVIHDRDFSDLSDGIYMYILRVAFSRSSLFESLGFSANFLPFLFQPLGTSCCCMTIVHLPHRNIVCPLLPLFHSYRRRCLRFNLATSVLTLISRMTRPFALSRFNYMQEVFFFYAREKGASRPFSRRRVDVFRFVFSFIFRFFSFSFAFLGGEHLAGSVGYSGTCKGGRATFQFLGGRDFLEDRSCVHEARSFFFFVARREHGHKPREFRIRPDAAGTERSIFF